MSSATPSHPPFSALPLRKSDPPYSAWGLYGPNDELGTLFVLLERRNRLESRPGVAPKSCAVPNSVVHERDKKHVLGGQSVTCAFRSPHPVSSLFTYLASSIGEIIQKKRDHVVDSVPYKNSDPIPYVTFIFKYRSRGEYCVPYPCLSWSLTLCQST